MAQWIWHLGEFEMLLGQRVWLSRYERQAYVAPPWRVEPVWPVVWFEKTVESCVPLSARVIADGEMTVQVNGQHQYHFNGLLSLPAGTYRITVTVVNRLTLPALFIDHPVLATDSSWRTSCIPREWKAAACWQFDDPANTPSSFKLATRPVTPVAIEAVGSGKLYDFGRELMAFLCLEGSGDIVIAYGESREEALDTEFCELYDTVSVDGRLTTEFTRAFRCVYLPEPGAVTVVSALYQYLPMENRGAFRCDNDLINRIYDTAIYTLHLNSREFFFDGIKRDRWVWSGDAAQSYLLNYYSFFDIAICKRTMRLLRGKNPIPTHINTIQDYTCYWFISLLDYHQYTGDCDFLESLYYDARLLMEYCEARTDSRGFLNAQPGDWVFVDWAPIDNSGDVAVIQLLYARALESMARMANLTGHAEDAARYWAAHEKTLDNCFATFWSDHFGCFTHGPAQDPNAVVTRYPNIFAVLFGYLDDSHRLLVARHVFSNSAVLPITTPYMQFYELMALCECGMLGPVWDFMQEYWGGMLELGATSFWEAYDPAVDGAAQYAMYERPYGKSLCHAWGAGPVMLLGKYFLGVRPTAPGYEAFEVKPCVTVGSLSGTVPTPQGSISVTVDGDFITVVNQTPGSGVLLLQDHHAQVIQPFSTKQLYIHFMCPNAYELNF